MSQFSVTLSYQSSSYLGLSILQSTLDISTRDYSNYMLKSIFIWNKLDPVTDDISVLCLIIRLIYVWAIVTLKSNSINSNF